MNIKSVSDENLENLVKQTVNATLKNNEQTIKFYQMIKEKWHLKKSRTSKGMKNERSHTRSQTTSEQNLFSTMSSRRLRQVNYKSRINQSSLEIQRVETSEIVKSLSKYDAQNFSSADNKESNNGDQVVSIGSATKVDDDGEVKEIWKSRKQQIGRRKNGKKNVLDVARTHDRNDGKQNHLSPFEQRKARRKLITFEAWMKSKAIAYRKILNQLKKEKEQKAVAALEDAKRRKAMLQARILLRKKQRRRQAHKFYSKYLAKQNCNRVKEKRVSEQKVVDESEEQATTSVMRKSSNKNNDQKKETAIMQDSLENVIFYSWLDQLNWILHKKYLRERRHLVRSFYCQPLYYGDATLYVT